MDAANQADQGQDKALEADDNATEKLATTKTELAALGEDAKAATNREHAMTLREALRKYPKAIGWSVLLSLAVAMEGYGKSDPHQQASVYTH
jgi:SP family general alpha glucoside:H+ symporter-like MFS transporter